MTRRHDPRPSCGPFLTRCGYPHRSVTTADIGGSHRADWPIAHESSHDPESMWFDCDTCDDLLDAIIEDEEFASHEG